MTKILAIDDINDNIISLRAVLKDTFPNAEFKSALDGYSGIELAKEFIPDIILLDIVMPGMDGFTVCRNIKQDEVLCDIPVVFLTALKDKSENRVLALDAGADGFLNKPIDEAELIAQVKAMLKIRDANITKRDDKIKLEILVNERTKELNDELDKRIAIENALRESESKFRIIFESANVGKSITLMSGEINVNQAFCDLLGYSKEELKNKRWQEITPYEDIESVQKQLNALISGESESTRLEKRYIHKSGSIIWANVSVAICRDSDKKPLYFITTVFDITERKRTEQALLDKEIQYRNLANSGSALVWTSGTDKLCNYFNEPWFRFTGRTLEQERGNGWTEGVHPDDFDRCLEIYISAFDKHDHFYMEYRLRHHSGEYRWISDTGTPNYNASGDFVGYIGHCFEIEEQKKAEQALKYSQELLSLFIKHSPVYAYIKKSTSETSKVLFASDNFIDMIGVPAAEMIGKNMYDLFPADFAKKIIDEDWAVVSEGKILTLDEELNGKNYITIKFPINQGDEKLLAGYSIDITERKLSEQALKESEYRFRSLHNASFGGIAIHNKGIILDCNQGLSNITGFSQNELLGMNGLLLISDDTRQIAIDNIELGYEKPYEAIGVRKDGTIYPLRLEGRNIPYKGKKARVVEFRDITEQKNVENELINAKLKAEESDRLKSAFLANMSHEIRTPMNGILGFSELLQTPQITGEQQLKYIRIIQKSGERMLNIINNIVDISKIEAGLMKLDLKESNVKEQVEFIYNFFKPEVEAKGIRFSLLCALLDNDSIVSTDREKLYAILTNLVKNSIKYTEKGEIELACYKSGKDLEFYVRDTGIGIPKDRQIAIFERFIQADIEDRNARQGAGLGLAITKSYVEMLGGKIWVESEEGISSTFYVNFPDYIALGQKNILQAADPLAKVSTKVSNLKVLIAEDDEVSIEYISIIVNSCSDKIYKARTGVEVVEICRNEPDIDLILMDIQMPVMNGYDATRQIREFNKDVIIIAQTAFGLFSDRKNAIESGCNDYIAKPLNKDELIAMIEKYF